MSKNGHNYGEGNIYKRGRIWHVLYFVDGRKNSESSHSQDRRVAVNLLKDRLAQKRTGQFKGLKHEQTRMGELFTDVIREYEANNRKTIRDLKIRLNKHLADGFGCYKVKDKETNELLELKGGKRACKVNNVAAQEYRAKRLAEGATEGTIWQELALLRHALLLGVENGKLREAPHIKLKKLNNAREGFVEYGQYRQLRDTLPDYLKAFLAVGFFTGIRKDNIARLRWSEDEEGSGWIDFLNRMVNLRSSETKNKEGYSVPMLPELYELLRLHRANSPDSPWVFPSPKGPAKPIRDFRKAWHTTCIRLGYGKMVRDEENGKLKYEGLLFHDLRRSAVRNLEWAGVPRSVAMKMTGHKTESVYRRYAIVSPRDLGVAEKMLGDYFAKLTTPAPAPAPQVETVEAQETSQRLT